MTNTPTSKLFREAAKKYGQLTDEEREFIAKERKRQEEAQLQAFIKSANASRIKKAGLFGDYATADCAKGREIYREAKKGHGFYYWGKCGRGKTYAAACAARLFIEEGKTAKLVTTSQYLNEIKSTWHGKGDAEVIRRRYAEYDLLVLDDFGVEMANENDAAELVALLDLRIKRKAPIVFTSNLRAGEMSNRYGSLMGNRITSRIGGICTLANIQEVKGEDWRLKCN